MCNRWKIELSGKYFRVNFLKFKLPASNFSSQTFLDIKFRRETLNERFRLRLAFPFRRIPFLRLIKFRFGNPINSPLQKEKVA